MRHDDDGPIEPDLARLYDLHAPELYRYLIAMVGRREDAEDALQNIWLKTHRRLAKIRQPRRYLWRAARNEARRILERRSRRQARQTPLSDSEASLELFPDGANPEVSAAERLAVAAALARLAFEQREAVVLMAFEGLSARESGERLGIPTDTAASRWRLALAKLRRWLAPLPAKMPGTSGRPR